jgi:hypothetical protein
MAVKQPPEIGPNGPLGSWSVSPHARGEDIRPSIVGRDSWGFGFNSA